MLKLSIFILIGMVSTIFSQNDLNVKIEKFEKVYTNPANSSEKFLEFSLEYPIFSGEGSASATANFLNREVAAVLFDGEGSAEAFFNKYVQDHKDVYEGGEGMGMGWSLESKLHFNKLTDEIGTFTNSGYGYSGGAHGGSWIYFFNYDLRNNKLLSLADVMNSNFLPQLTVEGEKVFRKEKNLQPNQSLEGDFWFENNKFHLNENFLFTRSGITFYYNEYEISCYACGTTEIRIPYTNIKSLINQNGLLKSFPSVDDAPKVFHEQNEIHEIYNSKTYKRDSAYVIDITWPVFDESKGNTEFAVKLNQLVTNLLPFSGANVKQTVNDMIATYKSMEQADDFGMYWTFTSDISAYFPTTNIVSIMKFEWEYAGGAHGNGVTLYFNIDEATQKVLTLDDLLIPGGREKLNLIAETIFRDDYEIAENVSLEDAGYSFKDNKFAVNENFLIDNGALQFTFNSYEIAPYAAGAPEVRIKFSEIKDLIRKDGPLKYWFE
ncbi:MAG: DUF3298 domain-containing protein [Ignavibacteriales bacterium]|nr:DUF3298 domain-containing protein [Ignavibacteriales bacterium]